MGRELRRVSMNFRYPLDQIWYGHLIDSVRTCMTEDGSHDYCNQCKDAAAILGVKLLDFGCPDWDGYLAEPMQKIKDMLAPPKGDGYQLWETTSEGSPISPVFATLDELCSWCEDNATVIGSIKVKKERWKELLTENDGFVIYDDGKGMIII